MKKKLVSVLVMATIVAMTLMTNGVSHAQSTVTLQFQQWWEPELPKGALRAMMDQFQTQNPGITVQLVSAPYSQTHDQVVAGAASGTMADVVGLDGAWVNDFVKENALADLTKLMTDAKYDASNVAAQIKLNGSTYMIPVVNFVYPVFVNLDIMKASGVTALPSTRTDFFNAAKAMTNPANYTTGWILPLSTSLPNGIQNDVMSWVWASGGSMLKDGKPNLVGNQDIISAMEYIKSMYDAGYIAKGAFSMVEQDKVEDFVNGRVGMMIDSLAHINLIRQRNPKLNFAITALPAADSYTGKRGLPYASWGIGVAQHSQHQAEAWKLIAFLLGTDVNSSLSSSAHGFPGNVKSTPDYVKTDPLFGAAFDVFQKGVLANEFTGLPVAEQLMRDFEEPFQSYLSGDIKVDELLSTAQAAWMKDFGLQK
ncbi:MAG: ABC transporter substrate-binding protein [Aggregatilineales bacterium]